MYEHISLECRESSAVSRFKMGVALAMPVLVAMSNFEQFLETTILVEPLI